ncbi:MAG: hypothetical protein ABI200_07515 [Gaiellales bacterium]
MTSDSHWSEQSQPEPRTEQVVAEPLKPRPALGVVAQRLADVSPAWAAAIIDPELAPSDDPLAATLGRSRAQGVESIREGWLLHRAASRLGPDASPDLALLMGDWCYAAGLCTIADHGSLDDVARLAALIANVSARADEPVEQLNIHWTETTEAMHHA